MAEFVRDLGRESTMIRRNIHTIMWHMRGSLTREEAWTLSPLERRDIEHLIDERIKIVEKTGLPLL